jgi:hypothetical protein
MTIVKIDFSWQFSRNQFLNLGINYNHMKTTTRLLSLLFLFFIANSYAQDAADYSVFAKSKVSPASVPDTYPFSWKYKMEIKSGTSKAMTAEYLLQPNAEYFGMKMSDMLMIMDTKKKLSISTFKKGDSNMATASKLPDYAAAAEKQNLSKFTDKSLPEKTILGYVCKGVEATNDDYVMVFYFTNDAPVNFADMFKSPQAQKMPDAFKNYFKPGDKPLMMEVEITEKAKKRTTTMKCLALEKSAFTFKKNDYMFL